MIKRLHHFFLSQKPFSTLSVFFVVYLGALFTSQFTNNLITESLQIAGGLFFLILGVGISITLILQWILKRKFDLWEFVSLSLLESLLIPPLILILEFSLFKSVNYWYPLANSLILWLISGILLFFGKTCLPALPNKLSLRNPFIIVLFSGIIFTSILVFSFQALPDLDPYKWLFKYVYQFANHILDTYERPLFGSFVYMATALTGIEVFNFFKYILPLFFLLILFPAWMVAKTFQEKNKQWLFLFFAFTSPVIILYAGIAMPQVPLIIISYFFVFFLLYSTIKKDDLFLYIAGISMLLAFFYHQLAFIVFAAWIIPLAIIKKKTLFSNKILLLLAAIILFLSVNSFRTIYDFAANWTERIIPSFFKENNLNLLYPAQYTNTDNNIMGWNSLTGVMKFYSFYAGPLVGFVLFIFVLLLFQKKFRSYILKQFKNNLALFILLFSFVSFFVIAEIFPRFPNISLLPDRAWIFCGIFAYIFLYLILKYIPKISTAGILLFAIFFAIGISGTIYINYLKRYLISPMQLESARWIKSNLPNNRIFLSFGYKNLLPVHADTPLVKMPADIYCGKDISEFQKFLDNLEKPLVNKKITIINPLLSPPEISEPILNEEIFRFNSISSLDGRPLYIYYSQQHLKNPYRGRPYSMGSWGIEPCLDGKFLFDSYPEKFTRIYDKKDYSDEVLIWKIL